MLNTVYWNARAQLGYVIFCRLHVNIIDDGKGCTVCCFAAHVLLDFNKVPADNSKNVNSDNEPHNANKVPADNSKNVNSDNESHNANTNLTSESASPPEIMQRSPSNCSSSSFLGHQ